MPLAHYQVFVEIALVDLADSQDLKGFGELQYPEVLPDLPA